jgi:hypothetical protein
MQTAQIAVQAEEREPDFKTLLVLATTLTLCAHSITYCVTALFTARVRIH